MTKETKLVVLEVKNVVNSLRMMIQQEKSITLDDFNKLYSSIEVLINDYTTTVDNFLHINSLVVKYEKLLEIIGLIEYASVNNTSLLDNTIDALSVIPISSGQK